MMFAHKQIRIMMFSHKRTLLSPLFYSLNIIKIEDLCKFKTAKFMYKLKNVLNFNYLHN